MCERTVMPQTITFLSYKTGVLGHCHAVIKWAKAGSASQRELYSFRLLVACSELLQERDGHRVSFSTSADSSRRKDEFMQVPETCFKNVFETMLRVARRATIISKMASLITICICDFVKKPVLQGIRTVLLAKTFIKYSKVDK